MKVSRFWVLSLVLGTALMFFSFSKNSVSSSIPDMAFKHSSASKITATSRKLEENGYNPSTNVGKVNLEDYHPIDPSPSSKASIRPGPIEHSSPLIPYIPKPPPLPSPSPHSSPLIPYIPKPSPSPRPPQHPKND